MGKQREKKEAITDHNYKMAVAAEKGPGGGGLAVGGPVGSGGGGAKVGLASNQRFVFSAAMLLVAMPVLLWTVDTSGIRTHLSPSIQRPQDYLLTTTAATATPDNRTSTTQFISTPSPATAPVAPDNRTSRTQPVSTPPAPLAPAWISASLLPNYSSTLLARWLSPGGSPCRESRTTNITIPALDHRDSATSPVRLPAGEIHDFVIHALDESGARRCLGGDYFETDLSGESWKSRPPVTDAGNGSYTMSLQVHPDFAGVYNLTVVLLFRSFEGLKFSTERFAYKRELRQVPIEFYRKPSGGLSAALPKLELCGAGDFDRDIWSGRWTRHARNDACSISKDGRYRCLDPDLPCRHPWCDGSLGSLESNGWVYSAHCSFRIFTPASAWQCLRNRWIFFWGDSNHVDTIRNLLNFVLGRPEIPAVPRRFDASFTNPANASESVRITSIFNGHSNETMNYQGLDSLRDGGFRALLWRYFTEQATPDVMILNSGLHDGIHFRSIRAFIHAADYAAEFWADVFRHWEREGKRKPAVLYRTTIATGGHARSMAFNPSKMEAFNGVMVEKLREKGLLLRRGGGVVDEFDMTYPWHWDNRCNDGVHYGRAPAKARWRDGEIGHQYFVDLMLGHVLLNAICPR